MAFVGYFAFSTNNNGDAALSAAAVFSGASTPTPASATPGRSASAPVPSVSPRPLGTATPVQPEVVAVASRTDQRLSLIDTASGKISASVDIGTPVQSMALLPDGQTAWVFSNKPGASDFVTVDLAKNAHTDSHRLRSTPSAAAFSSDGRRAYVTLGGGNESPPLPSSVVFLDAKNGSEFGHVDLGQTTPGVQIQRRLDALAVTSGPTGDVVYVAGHASGTVWALDGGSGGLVAQIETGGGPIALVPDSERQAVYVLADTTNELLAVSTVDQSITKRLSLPGRPGGAALAPNGMLYVSGTDMGEVWPIDLTNWRVGSPVAVGSQPAGLAISLNGERAYVTLAGDGALAVLDLEVNQVASKIVTGKDTALVVVARGRGAATASASPAAAAASHPTPTPTMVPSPTPLPDGAQPAEHLPAGVVAEQFMPADSPVSLAFAPDGTLFYNELHTGKIRVVQNGTLLPDPFFQFKVAGQPETGLIGLALDPDFDTNHYVYVFYTSVPDGQDNGGTNGPNEVVRLTDVNNKGTELTPILRDLPSGPIHNSGTLRFGPDGKLYLSLGDNDQGSNAQDLGSMAGKILRVNSDGTIPDDNPFAGQPGKQGAVWAYGLRNPFSFDFDPLQHGLFATENGPGDNDELDLIIRGANYGWPPTGYKFAPGVVDPIAVMNPPIGPTGAAFFTGNQVPDWKNDLFYCNYHQGQLRRVHLAPESRDRVVFEEVAKKGCSLGIANAPDGALYYTDAKGIYRVYSVDAVDLIAAPTGAAAASAEAAPTSTPEELPEGTRPEDRDVNVSLSEWKLQPSRTKVPAGTIRFLAEDTGETAHAFRIEGQGLDVSTDDFGAGESRTLQMVLAPGEYRLVCPIPGHEQQGMAATLTVVGP
ncbi:MAG: PQQ-dependent sugar dehydrogenase [Chloroflexi bacterium]|nr:PQQ-dependent sugar dehydrogenase [Chloroflexota bacterium]